MEKGLLIVIEGTDGSGKNTQAGLLVDAIQGRSGNDVPEAGFRKAIANLYGSWNGAASLISFPRYGTYSATMVEAYLQGKFGKDPESVDARTASLFYSLDRFAAYRDRTEPGSWGQNYDDGGIVVADRYTTSNIVHQMEKLVGFKDRTDYIAWLQETEYGQMGIPKPDLVLFLDMPIEVTRELRKKRAQADPNHKNDIHEADEEFLERSRQSGLFAARYLGWKVIPCAVEGKPRGIGDIQADVRAAVLEYLENPDGESY